MALLFSSGLALYAATPFTRATVTRVENRVDRGEVRAGRTIRRPAAVADVIRDNNFLLTETESRAELEYEDGSVVRIGQNTVFSFDAATRRLTLEKGSLIFYIPSGSGGGQIKTPSLTAAITGTVGKVSTNTIAILEGEVRLIPSGRTVGEGMFARANPDGSISIRPFDRAREGQGELMKLGGRKMPGYRGLVAAASPGLALDLSQLNTLNTLEIGTNLPSSNAHFFPINRERTDVRVPERIERPVGNGNGGGPDPYTGGGTGASAAGRSR